ncbi:MAG: tRNA epoxyqueuosine(34) reductase QueG [Rhodospirillaceae bacterium]|nr:tRNA epoxyqueuosine(34) reductase QueG [Rhodospirillaceae bacterium]|tara:strand:+ start:1053 stop:2177 length:1125 start_codon:yes stop_codon:yes gene_type:complete
MSFATEPKSKIRNRALELGFDAVGFAPAEMGGSAGKHLANFLKKGWHGDMGWLESRSSQRKKPRNLWPEANSIIAVALNYGPKHNPLDALTEKNRGSISVYAQGRDYHKIIKKRLRILAHEIHHLYKADVKLFVDTAPVMEKPIARAAGLGWQGKHTNLVSRHFGSWIFLGEIFTTLKLEPDTAAPDHCGSCTSCIDTCPTNAFPEPYKLDARRCISYLTIEHSGPIPHEFREAIGNRIYGCDDCLSVCPWNRFAQTHKLDELNPHVEKMWPHLADLVELDDASFREIFSGSPIKRLGRDRFIRNVLIAIGNSGEKTHIEKVKLLVTDPCPSVRGAAVWTLHRLLKQSDFKKLRYGYVRKETDPTVLAEWELPN